MKRVPADAHREGVNEHELRRCAPPSIAGDGVSGDGAQGLRNSCHGRASLGRAFRGAPEQKHDGRNDTNEVAGLRLSKETRQNCRHAITLHR
jgi:hypothetical protein